MSILAAILNLYLNKVSLGYLISKNICVIDNKWRIIIYENKGDRFVKSKNGLKIKLIKRQQKYSKFNLLNFDIMAAGNTL